VRSRGTGPLTEGEYREIYAKVPRLAVEVLVRNDAGAVFLTRRAQDPCRGLWHVPGGTVQFGERLADAVRRTAARELAIDVQRSELRGVIEYPSHFEHGLGSPVGLVYEAVAYSGDPRAGADASDGGWFTTLPRPMHADQDSFLLEHHLVAG
jgi:ADP-ribose pyrophosphatase YjhB (NUDIX family)